MGRRQQVGRRSPLTVSPDKDGFACLISRLLMVVCTPVLLGVPQDGAGIEVLLSVVPVVDTGEKWGLDVGINTCYGL